jgi:hypothetical protein
MDHSFSCAAGEADLNMKHEPQAMFQFTSLGLVSCSGAGLQHDSGDSLRLAMPQLG